MSELPMNWKPATLAEICLRLVDGSHNPPKAVGQGFPMLSARNIQNRQINFDEFRFISDADFAVEHARTNVQPGDVLLTIVGAIGRSAVVPTGLQQFALQRSVAVLKPLLIESRYLSYALQSPDTQKYLEENAKGTAQKGIYLGALSGVEIPVAPLNEQKRITDKLDALLMRVDACRKRLERVPRILKSFRQAVLAAAMSGQLTEDWPRNNEGWRTLPLGSVLTDIRYGTAQKSHYNKKNGTPVLRIPNIGDGLIDPSDLKFGVFSKKELDTLSLKAGDLLLIRSNGSLELVGKVALVEPKFEGYLYAGYLIRLRLNTSIVVPQFLRLFLSSPAIRRYIELTARSTSGVNNINTEEIRSIQLKLPSIEEQGEIVRRVEALFAYVARLEARYKSVRTRVEQLTPALLAKAFRGELVPRDPKDEPASVLLERIRASRATAEGEEEITRAKRRTNLVKKPKARIIMLKRKDVEPSHLSAILKSDGPLSAEALWSASQLDIDDFYDQLKDEEARGLLKENAGEQRLLEAA